MKILVTGIAGFIGSHVAARLISEGHEVVGIDNYNDYYDPTLKRARTEHFLSGVPVYEHNIANRALVEQVFKEHHFDRVCHLAAQAGVRYSIENPWSYAEANYIGTLNIFESAHRAGNVPVVYASSSSVYGASTRIPFTETDPCDTPLSVYAASKRATELLAHNYWSMYGMGLTGLRFFTVYGPWGRPDMSLFMFTKAAFDGTAIEVFNRGNMLRDFTYIDDVVDGVVRALAHPRGAGVYNLGRGAPVPLSEFISQIEHATGKKIMQKHVAMQPGDVPETHANITKAEVKLGYAPTVHTAVGVKQFVDWYQTYYKV